MARPSRAGQNTFAKFMNDAGLGAWFGGSLMGAVGLNAASKEIPDRSNRMRAVNAGWGRWTPVNLGAIAAHLLGAAQLLMGNRSRVTAQRGVATASAVKAVLTAAALGATAYSRVLGQRLMDAEGEAAQRGSEPPMQDVTTPTSTTPTDVAAAQRQLTVLQWAVPALTGSMVLLDAKMSEQQRPLSVLRGVARRVLPG